jgi:hypothetical protein
MSLKKLSFEEWRDLPLPERRLLMRAAFGDPSVPECFVSDFDLEALRDTLERHEAETAVLPQKWTASDEDDLGEQL